jgi:hypothetical protein
MPRLRRLAFGDIPVDALPRLASLTEYREEQPSARIADILGACPQLRVLHVSFSALVSTNATFAVARHASLRTLRCMSFIASSAPVAYSEAVATEHCTVVNVRRWRRRLLSNCEPTVDYANDDGQLVIELAWCHNPLCDDAPDAGAGSSRIRLVPPKLKNHDVPVCICSALPHPRRQCEPRRQEPRHQDGSRIVPAAPTLVAGASPLSRAWLGVFFVIAAATIVGRVRIAATQAPGVAAIFATSFGAAALLCMTFWWCVAG